MIQNFQGQPISLTVVTSIVCGVFVAALIFTLILVRTSKVLGLIDAPAEGKVHAVSTPRSGGVAIFLATSMGVLILAFLTGNGVPLNLFVSLGLVAAFVIGLVDDRRSLPPVIKLILIMITALVSVTQFDITSLALQIAMILLTVLITNAVNLLDGADGLAGGVMPLILVALGIRLALSGEPGLTYVALVAASAVTGFLVFNLRGRIFMGDCGSLFLGFFASMLIAALAERGLREFAFGVVCVSVPLFDTAFVVSRRAWLRRPLFKGDLNHSYNVLERQTGSKPAVLSMFYGATLLSLLIAFLSFGG